MPGPSLHTQVLCGRPLLASRAISYLSTGVAGLAVFVLISLPSETFGRRATIVSCVSCGYCDQEEIHLPTNHQEPFLVLAYTGGFRAPRQPGDVETPFLRVFPDGRVITGAPSANAPVSEFKLDEQQLRQLVNDIVTTDRFFEIDSAKIADQIKASGNRITIVDAPDTEITLVLADRQHHVKQYATMFIGRQFPEIKSLVDLLKTEKRLRVLHATAQIGGHQQLEKLLAAVNDKCSHQIPAMPPLSSDDLTWANRQKDNRLEITFTKRFPDIQSREELSVVISVKVAADGTNDIQIGDPMPVKSK